MTHLARREMYGGYGGQCGGRVRRIGPPAWMDKLVHWTAIKTRPLFMSAARKLTRIKQQYGGRGPTLHERYCRRVLHGSKLKKKKRTLGVAAPPRKREKRTERVAPTVAAPITTIALSAPMLRSPVMTRSRRRGIM